jgi:hypothetical protein
MLEHRLHYGDTPVEGMHVQTPPSCQATPDKLLPILVEILRTNVQGQTRRPHELDEVLDRPQAVIEPPRGDLAFLDA